MRIGHRVRIRDVRAVSLRSTRYITYQFGAGETGANGPLEI